MGCGWLGWGERIQMIIKLKYTLVNQDERYLGHTYWLANEGWLQWVVLQTLVILWLKLGIVRLVERIHVELRKGCINLGHEPAYAGHVRLASEELHSLLNTCRTNHYSHSKRNNLGRKSHFRRSRTQAVRRTTCSCCICQRNGTSEIRVGEQRTP